MEALVMGNVSLPDANYNSVHPDDIEFLLENFLPNNEASRDDAFRIVEFIINRYQLRSQVQQLLMKRRRRRDLV